MKKQLYPLLILTLASVATQAQTLLKADGKSDAYALISKVLGGNACEVPDCIHPVPHIVQVFDPQLNEYVFGFRIHATPDNDRCKGFDRQRVEIKTYSPSPARLKGELGETVTYTWKFKIDSNFKAQPTFTHIHQIKAGDGDAGAPIITLTPRYGNPDKLEVIHTGSSKQTTLGKLTETDLAPFKGTWVEVTETLHYDTKGSYNISIKRVSDGKELLSYTNNNIDLWRSNTSFCRPKWGIYRSLKSPQYIRDEEIRFADITIAEH